MKQAELFLAADSGGSKTIWTLLTKEAEVVFEYRTRGLGAVKAGIAPIEEIITEAAEMLKNFGIIKQIYLSLGGPNTNEIYEMLKKTWPEAFVVVEREANGNAVLYAASFLKCSSVVMCGTGSTAVGLKHGKRCYSGGWGPVYGDGGSGGGLGSSALRIFLRSLDESQEIGAIATLFQPLMKGLTITNFEDRMELKARALNMKRDELAALALKIYTYAENGDELSVKLYEQAAEDVASMALAVSDTAADTNVLLCGGFFANKPIFINMCKTVFAKKSSANLVYNELFNPSTAAQMMLLKQENANMTPKLFEKILYKKKGSSQ